MLSRRASIAFGTADALAAAVVAYGVFGALPARWWPVDAAAVGIAGAMGAAAAGLLLRARWGEDAARVASGAALTAGLALVAALALTASYLSGIYGAVGRGGATILLLAAALAVPYLVVLPAVQLVMLGPRREREGEAS